MMTPADIAQMQADLSEMRADNQVTIQIRRGNTTLANQQVRVARLSGGQEKQGQNTQESRGKVVVVGSLTFDVKVNDRFNADGLLYRVSFVRPNDLAAVIAEAELVE